MKGKTRRRLQREQVNTANAIRSNQEAWKTTRYVATSIAQGDPRTTLSVAAILGGGVLKVLSVATTQLRVDDEAPFEPYQTVLDQMGSALWAVAAVNEAGQLVDDVMKSIRGTPVVPTAYDVSDAPGAGDTVSVSSTSSGFLA